MAAKVGSAVQSASNAPWRALGPWSDTIPFGRLPSDAVPIPPPVKAAHEHPAAAGRVCAAGDHRPDKRRRLARRGSATAAIGFQLHHPLPIDGDAHAVATSLWPCRPGPPRGRRLTATGIALGLLAIWAALVPLVA